MNAVESNSKCYRLERSILHIGIYCTVGFLAFDIASTAAAYWNLDGSFAHPTRDAIVFAAFWSGFSLLSAALIAYYLRYRLCISDNQIEQVGLVWTRAVDSSQVTAVRWRMIWNDVVLYAGRKRLRIELEGLAVNDRQEVIGFLRDRLDPSIQQGWPLFSKHCFAQSVRPHEPWSWRRLALGMFLASLGTFAWFFLFIWLVGGGRQNLAIGVVLAIVLLICVSLPATWRELRRTKVSRPFGAGDRLGNS